MSKPLTRTVQNVVSSADHGILEGAYTFIPKEAQGATTWQDRMVKRYHDGLHKEFALADLSRPGKVGLRWRTKQEVLNGRGESSCGNKRCQNTTSDLVILQVPFSYQENGVAKKELVKLTLCSNCEHLVRSPHALGKKRKKTTSEKNRCQNENHDSGTNICREGSKSLAKSDARRSHSKKRSRGASISDGESSQDISYERKLQRGKSKKHHRRREKESKEA